MILAAGKGTRMKSRLPKVLHKVCGKEMVRHVVDAVSTAGFDRIVVVTSSDAQDAVQNVLDDTVEYVVQTEQLGTGHATLQAKARLNGVETVFILNGDVPLIRSETIRVLADQHDARKSDVTMLTAYVEYPTGLGRVVREPGGTITAIVEDHDADDSVKAIKTISVGVFCVQADWLWQTLGSARPAQNGEFYLTDVVANAVGQDRVVESINTVNAVEGTGVNDRVQLAVAEAVVREGIRECWMVGGVTMPDPSSVYIDADASIGEDTVVLPNTHIQGASRIGRGCVIGPNSIVSHSVVADDCRIQSSVVEDTLIGSGVEVGPFSHLRAGTHIDADVHIGNFVEITRSHVGSGTKSKHFSYVGDAEVGQNVSIGAGAITANYDGDKKLSTRIGDGAFVGSDTMLVAPITVGKGAQTGAGAVVTKDVPAGALAVGVPARLRAKPDSKDP